VSTKEATKEQMSIFYLDLNATYKYVLQGVNVICCMGDLNAKLNQRYQIFDLAQVIKKNAI
jgi:hypothetical protein